MDPPESNESCLCQELLGSYENAFSRKPVIPVTSVYNEFREPVDNCTIGNPVIQGVLKMLV